MASWGCPHEIDGKCTKINPLPCDPGMKGLRPGRPLRLRWQDEKNRRLQEKQARGGCAETRRRLGRPPGRNPGAAGRRVLVPAEFFRAVNPKQKCPAWV